MKKTKKIFLIIFLGFLVCSPLLTLSKEEETESHEKPLEKSISDLKYKENEVIVKYKKNVIKLENDEGKEKAKDLEEEKGLTDKGIVPELNMKLLHSVNKNTEELITELENDPNVEYVEPNYIKKITHTPNDTYFNNQWALNNTGQTGGTSDADIDSPEAWDGENNTDKIIVAVLDTGVRYTHEDLVNNMWNGSTGCNDENNNPIPGGCPNHGWDFQNDDNNPLDDDGHGTFISGIIAGESNNSKGISGSSRYNDIEIMAVKIGSSSISVFDEIKGINFANNNGAEKTVGSFFY